MNKRLCLSLSFPILMLIGCNGAQSKPADKRVADKPITVNTQLCHATVDFTSRVVVPYTIKIFEPNDPKNPDIWQGPICVHSEIKKVGCGFSLSLIKSVTPVQDRNSIDVVVFSGSNSRTARITLDTCKIIFLD